MQSAKMKGCLKQEESDVEKSYYKPGFSIDYTSADNQTATKTEKSDSNKKDNPPKNTNMTSYKSRNVVKTTPSKAYYPAQDPAVTADRCRVAIEGHCSGLISIEGHGKNRKLQNYKSSK